MSSRLGRSVCLPKLSWQSAHLSDLPESPRPDHTRSLGGTAISVKQAKAPHKIRGLHCRYLRECRFRLGHDLTEGIGFVHGEIGQNLAVHFDPGQTQRIDEA